MEVNEGNKLMTAAEADLHALSFYYLLNSIHDQEKHPQRIKLNHRSHSIKSSTTQTDARQNSQATTVHDVSS